MLSILPLPLFLLSVLQVTVWSLLAQSIALMVCPSQHTTGSTPRTFIVYYHMEAAGGLMTAI